MAYTLKDFEKFCSSLTLDTRKPFVLEGFQKQMLRDYFAGATETVIIIPKKNGKTTLLGALALFHLKENRDAECVIVAAARDQAAILFRQALGLIQRSNLETLFTAKQGRYEIRLAYTNEEGKVLLREVGGKAPPGRIRVLAADASTADGVIPTLALVDELHRHRSPELYGVLRDGLGPRQGQMITISTAGADINSPLGELRKQAHQMKTFTRRGVKNHARSEDGSFVLHEWCLTDRDDLADLKAVKKTNPASWQTLSALKRRYDSPSTTPAQWARFACGVWTEGEEPWLEPAQWDRLKVDIGGVEEGEDVHLDVSFGSVPAIAIVARREDGVAVRAEVLPDASLEQLENRVVELGDIYRVTDLGYDRLEFQRSAELLEKRGVVVVEVPHSPERLSLASGTLRRLIASRELRHDGDPVLREQVLAGRTKESERGWRLVKTPETRALIAMAMAVHRATQETASEPLVAWA